MASVWDIDGTVDLAKAGWASGEEARAIAASVNAQFRVEIARRNLTPLTKSGVIGKMHRVGMPKRDSSNRNHAARGAGKRRKAAALAHVGNVPANPPPTPREPKFKPEPVARISNFMPDETYRIYRFAQLDVPRPKLGETDGVRHCRWIYGNPVDLFTDADNPNSFLCGCSAEPRRPYCKQHELAAMPEAGPATKTKGEVIPFKKRELVT